MKNPVEEELSNIFTIAVCDDDWIAVECLVRTRNLVRGSTRDMFVYMFRTRYVRLLAGLDARFLMILAIS